MALKKFNRIGTTPSAKPLNIKEAVKADSSISENDLIIKTLRAMTDNLDDAHSHIHDIAFNANGSLDIKGMCDIRNDPDISPEDIKKIFNNDQLLIKINSIDVFLQLYGLPIKSLTGLPTTINGQFRLMSCPNVVNFVDGPKIIKQHAMFSNLKSVESLEGFPVLINDDCMIHKLPKLTSLKKSEPTKILGNNLTLKIEHCPIKSLSKINKFFSRVDGKIIFSNVPITSNILSLLHIEGLKEVIVEDMGNEEFKKAIAIVNKHLAGGNSKSALVECMQEMEEAGLDDFSGI